MFVFKNKGVLTPASITTFGVSSKEKKNPIGFFGTGLKYAIAVLLRLDCSIKILSGGTWYNFSVEKTQIRKDTFNIVTMNGEPVSFTTELGKTWEAWQAFRELACNTIDEDGEYFESAGIDFMSLRDDHTYVFVEGYPFAEAWRFKDTVILPTAPIDTTHELGDCEEAPLRIHPGKSNHVYYRGIRVHELQKPSRFTYNITAPITLTEDRTISGNWIIEYYIKKFVATCTDVDVLERILLAGDAYAEHRYGLDTGKTEFMEIVSHGIKNFDRNLNPQAAVAVRALKFSDFVIDETQGLNIVDSSRLVKAVSFLKRAGYPVDEYKIVVSNFIGEGILGMAAEDTIFVSKKAFDMGTKMLAGTIFEEWCHLKHKFEDHTGSFQNFLVDNIMSQAEIADGAPL